MKHKIVKNSGKGYTIELYFAIGHDTIMYVVYVDTKKKALSWMKDNKKMVEEIRKGLSGF